MRISLRQALTVVAAGLLAAFFVAPAMAAPESVYTENEDSGNCQNGLVDNVISELPFQLWVKDATLDEMDITDDGVSVDSWWFHAGSCDRFKGNSNKVETYELYLVCAELYDKPNENPESFSATAFLTDPFENIGTDTFRWSGEDLVDESVELDACCNEIIDGYVWDGEECVLGVP